MAGSGGLAGPASAAGRGAPLAGSPPRASALSATQTKENTAAGRVGTVDSSSSERGGPSRNAKTAAPSGNRHLLNSTQDTTAAGAGSTGAPARAARPTLLPAAA